MRARAWLVIVVALSLVGTAACSSRSSATIEVDKPVALADAPVHVRVSGLGSGRRLPGRRRSELVLAGHAERTFLQAPNQPVGPFRAALGGVQPQPDDLADRAPGLQIGVRR